jgi:uncharacterized membrane protein YbhN (UPF0104 family)
MRPVTARKLPLSRAQIKNTVGTLIVLCIAFFFYQAFKQNWTSLKAHTVRPDYVSLLGAAALIFACLLTGTYGWQLVINSLSDGRKLRFSESVATVNSSNLTKYVPGRIWSYALQMYWLGRAGIRVSLVVYANLVNHAISLISCIIVGLACLAFVLPASLVAPLLVALALILLADLVGIRFHSQLLRRLLPVLGKLVGREIQHIDLPAKTLVRLHGLHLAGAVLSGLCAYLMCLGIGYPITPHEALLVTASSLLGEVAGTLVLIVPGGLGVREGVMYYLLGGASNSLLALVFPIASRLLTMIVDVILGAISFAMLRKFNQPVSETVETTPAADARRGA